MKVIPAFILLTSWWVLGTGIMFIYLWALHYHKEGATRSLVSTLFVFIRLLFSTFSFSPRSIPGFETGTTLLMITPLMKILKIHHPLSQRVWVRCRERCGNLKIGNFWIKWGERESPVLLMRRKLYFTTFKIKFLDCIRRWIKLTQAQYKEENYTFKDSI